ncbi:hypothetical protein DSO57_1008419 [Entomophthora muscae]|uniref:Uncharacterized protein n=1 Tax=Entomophthora muscae TaxID=34485 RepID=A0ACC2SK40_9FUNG|nr:hypothetical protein DSO57_1008419 [Entomophthora muscae]
MGGSTTPYNHGEDENSPHPPLLPPKSGNERTIHLPQNFPQIPKTPDSQRVLHFPPNTPPRNQPEFPMMAPVSHSQFPSSNEYFPGGIDINLPFPKPFLNLFFPCLYP